MNELQRIVARTRAELHVRRAAVPLERLEAEAAARATADPPRPFASALARADGLFR